MNRPDFILLNVEVTQNDINQGDPRCCWFCPIAIAVNRAANEAKIPGSSTVYSGSSCSAGKSEIELYTAYGRYSAITPAACERFMTLFDLGQPVAPFSCSLNLHFADDQRVMVDENTGEVHSVLIKYADTGQLA